MCGTGKWEEITESGEYVLPALDACGAHFGATPDSPSTPIYHYHMQDFPPFVVGCYGPSATGGLVSLATCRSLYPECGDAADLTQVTTPRGTYSYNRWCPCFDADGSNVE